MPAMATTDDAQLAAIMATDVEGYGSLASGDDQLARELIAEHFTILRDVILRHDGREAAAADTGLLIFFGSGREALRCAIAIQDRLRRRNALAANERRLEVRIGLTATEVTDPGIVPATHQARVAKRLASVAPSGGICVSATITGRLDEDPETPLLSIGMPTLEDGAPGPEAFRVVLPWDAMAGRRLVRIRGSWVAVAVALCVLAGLLGAWVGFHSIARLAVNP
jgi:adenylate cyclase